MMEIVFVIVILGILAAIAIPKLALGRSDACITKLRGEISAVRSTINLEQSKEFLLGNAPTLLPQAKLAKLLSLHSSHHLRLESRGGKIHRFCGHPKRYFHLKIKTH